MKLFEKMEKSEVGGKEVKRRKRSVEKRSSGEAANSSECKDHKVVADVVLTSPVAETKPSEVTTVETAEIKCEDTESFAVDVIDTKDAVETCTLMDVVQGNDQCDVAANTSNDLSTPTADVEVQSSHRISESRLSSNESSDEPIMQRSPTDTKLPEKIADVKVETTITDAVDIIATIEQPKPLKVKAKQDNVKVPSKASFVELSELDTDKRSAQEESIAVTDKRKPVKVKAKQDKDKVPSKAPCVKLSELDADNKSTQEDSITVTDKAKPVTAKTMQTEVKTVSSVMKSAVASEAKSRVVKGSPKPLSTAKLKFGMYSRKPLASRMWVKADEHVSESSSDSNEEDEDTAEERITELETTKPKCHSVKFV